MNLPFSRNESLESSAPRKLFSKKMIVLIIAVVVLGIAALAVTLLPKKPQQNADQPITLTYWGVFDNATSLQPIFDAYKAQHPNVTIQYEQKNFTSYEQDLKTAFIENRGPDLFSLPNTWVPRLQFLMAPEPSGNQLLAQDFFDVVAKDAVVDNQLYALPYSVDSLALFVNNEVMKEIRITNPPATWDEFNSIVRRATKIGPSGELERSGVALGTSAKTINRATDIVSFFLLQDGLPLSSTNHAQALFLKPDPNDSTSANTTSDGEQSMARYLAYGKPTEQNYSWNESQKYSFDAFAENKVAMIFSYAYGEGIVRGLKPKLDFSVVPAPQYPNALNKVAFANYWLEGVSASSANAAAAWDFLIFATSTDQARIYSERTGKPTARRDLVNEQLANPDLAAFVEQAPYATSWYQYDPQKVEQLINNFLVNQVSGLTPLHDGLEALENDISTVLRTGADERTSHKEEE